MDKEERQKILEEISILQSIVNATNEKISYLNDNVNDLCISLNEYKEDLLIEKRLNKKLEEEFQDMDEILKKSNTSINTLKKNIKFKKIKSKKKKSVKLQKSQTNLENNN
eukprot:TRINITY_DN7296_c0_g1_i1.p2 TRINITY_DN7296_c0_g1~~TRINITY_DN7296_c0_g1_i1.p2  ORF type:complete len:110 (+),score=32.69 TRINITY_DN7296_c0_g1_i1:454-783(+)